MPKSQKSKLRVPEISMEIDKMNLRLKEIAPDTKAIYYYYFEDQYRILAGRILTIVDASISDKQQNKCVKDLIKSEFHRRINTLQEMYWEGKEGHNIMWEGKEKDPLNN